MKYPGAKSTLMLLISFVVASDIYAQLPDSLLSNYVSVLEDQKETPESNVSDYLMEIDQLLQQGLDLNDEQHILQLVDMKLLTDYQAKRIREYRYMYGDLLTRYELLYIEGITKEDIHRIFNYVVEKKAVPKVLAGSKRIRQSLMVRYQRLMQVKKGYLDSDSLTRFLGSPDYVQLRYDANKGSKLRFGFVAEKDPGEQWLTKVQNGREFLYQTPGADHTSFYIQAQHLGFIKNIVAGHFKVQFGQGLNIWTGFAPGKSNNTTQTVRRAKLFSPHSSAEENRFMRGAAIHTVFRQFTFAAFYSSSNVDASILEYDSSEAKILSVSESSQNGNHRSINEQQRRKVLTKKIVGAITGFENRIFSINLIGIKEFNSARIYRRDNFSNNYLDSGHDKTILGIEGSFIIDRLYMFSEISVLLPSAIAWTAGIEFKPSPIASFAMTLRSYSADYFNQLSSGFASSSGATNEQGIYTGIDLALTKFLHLGAYADISRHERSRYSSKIPSVSSDLLCYIRCVASPQTMISFRYRNRIMQEKTDGYDHLPKLDFLHYHQLRFQLDYNPPESIALRTRIEWSRVNSDHPYESNGLTIYQDITIHPLEKNYSFSARLCIYDTDDYNSRIYAYEKDVLYAFTIVPYYGRGYRNYLLFNCNFTPSIKIWLRFGFSYYTDRWVMGSGAEEIAGNVKTDFKAMIRFKF